VFSKSKQFSRGKINIEDVSKKEEHFRSIRRLKYSLVLCTDVGCKKKVGRLKR